MNDFLTSWLPAAWHDFVPVIAQVLRVLGVLFAYWAALVVVRRALRSATKHDRMDRTAAAFVQTVARYGLLGIAAIVILGDLGVDTSSLLGSVGILGLTIGFAARDALSNVISGLFILWDRPFVIDDLIEIGGEYGRVERITMRSTRVVTPDGRMLAIPNTAVVNTTVASYTNFPHLRLDVSITVGVEENLGRVRELLLGCCEAEGFLAEPAARVVITELNDYNVAVELQAWIVDETQHISMRFALRECMFEALRDAGIHMPYETLELAPVVVKSAPEAA